VSEYVLTVKRRRNELLPSAEAGLSEEEKPLILRTCSLKAVSSVVKEVVSVAVRQ